jgi:uncharacterized protein (TIGR03086 family)
MENIADRYRRLSLAMTERIAAVPGDRWSSPSPCEGWTARDLVAHLVDVHGRFQGLVGRDLVAHPEVDEDPLGAWCAVRDQMQADLQDPAKVDEEYDGRLGRSTFGRAVDGFVYFDLVVHGWDLARATGQDDTIDPRDVERVQASVDAMGDLMRSNGVIGEPLDPGPDASAQQRLLGALGRPG